MTHAREVNVRELIDRSSISNLQIKVIALCTFVSIIDGFDLQALVFVAPVLASEWKIDRLSLGPALASVLVGVMIGALVFGVAADRFGRRKMVLLSIALFGIFSFLTPQANSISELMILRVLTGIGVGGAYPNVAALTSEYVPRRIRSLIVTLMFSGFSMGAVLGGIVSTKLIALYGWHAVFYFGGAIPLLVIPLIAAWLPESLYFLAARNRSGQQVERILRGIEGQADTRPARLMIDESVLSGSPVKELFSAERGGATVLIWLGFFNNLVLLGFLFNWLPLVLREAGLSLDHAIYGVVALHCGGILGGVGLGWLVDKRGPYQVLPLSFVIGAMLTAAVGMVGSKAEDVLYCVLFAAGMFAIGTQFCMYAFAAQFYPPEIRATGVGWATGVGRIGAIVGPVLGGLILSLNMTLPLTFVLASLPALIAAIAVFAVGKIVQKLQHTCAASVSPDGYAPMRR
jgi:AAHS family 4-hydroxybenzoate transporter-like MFS transporter